MSDKSPPMSPFKVHIVGRSGVDSYLVLVVSGYGTLGPELVSRGGLGGGGGYFFFWVGGGVFWDMWAGVFLGGGLGGGGGGIYLFSVFFCVC